MLGYLLDDDCSNLARLISLDYKNYGTCSLSIILDYTDDEGVKKLIINLGSSEDIVSEYNYNVFVDTVNRINRELKLAEIDKIKSDINEYDSKGDKEKVKELLNKFQKLAKELKENF